MSRISSGTVTALAVLGADWRRKGFYRQINVNRATSTALTVFRRAVLPEESEVSLRLRPETSVMGGGVRLEVKMGRSYKGRGRTHARDHFKGY